MLTETKELTIQVVNEDMIIYQIENVNEEIEIIKKKNQVEIMELKSKIIDVK